jgi:hypothetical protein
MSLGLLVGRFSDFLQEEATSPSAATPDLSSELFPADLTRIREAVGHHFVPLMWLSRCDGESALAERQVVLSHCLERARQMGVEATLAEVAALTDHLRDFRPTRAQLQPALKRLERDSKDDIIALVAAAKAVVDADGVRRPREVRFLDELSRDLSAL